MLIIQLFLILSILSILSGQLIRIPISATSNINITDVFVSFTVLSFLIHSLAIKKSIKINAKIVSIASVFILIATSSTIIAVNNFNLFQVLASSLFLIRFVIYFLLAIVVLNTIKVKNITKWLNVLLTVSVLFVILGLIQLVFLPDFTFLVPFGWDPHQRRLASTFLDPNFAGGFLTIVFLIATSLYTTSKKYTYLLLSMLFFSALILTFSRSSYLAVLVGITLLGVLRSKKILIGFLIFFAAAILLIGQVRSRILGAVTIDETSQARLDSWEKGITIFRDNLPLGVGFNTYRLAQSQYGFFSVDSPSGGHSGSGVDSSFLLVAATTGITGLFTFTALITYITYRFLKISKNTAIGLGGASALIGLVVHSQFVNSLFFPQIMLVLWFTVGLALLYDN